MAINEYTYQYTSDLSRIWSPCFNDGGHILLAVVEQEENMVVWLNDTLDRIAYAPCTPISNGATVNGPEFVFAAAGESEANSLLSELAWSSNKEPENSVLTQTSVTGTITGGAPVVIPEGRFACWSSNSACISVVNRTTSYYTYKLGHSDHDPYRFSTPVKLANAQVHPQKTPNPCVVLWAVSQSTSVSNVPQQDAVEGCPYIVTSKIWSGIEALYCPADPNGKYDLPHHKDLVYKSKSTILTNVVVDGSNNYAFVGCLDGSLVCVDLSDGQEVWRLPTSSNTTDASGAIVGNLAIAGNTLYAANLGGELLVVQNCTSSKPRIDPWQLLEIPHASGVVICDNRFVCTGGSTYYGYSKEFSAISVFDVKDASSPTICEPKVISKKGTLPFGQQIAAVGSSIAFTTVDRGYYPQNSSDNLKVPATLYKIDVSSMYS